MDTFDEPETLRSEFASDPDMGELVELFLEELPDRVDEIRESLQNHDTETVRRLSHQMKGAAGGYGYPSITDAAGRIESLINSDDTQDALAKIEEGVEVLCRLCAAAIRGKAA